jgi:hypothetical protein
MKKVILLLVFLGAALAADKQFWEHKSFDQWSPAECQKMLHDSPWAKSITMRQATMRQLNRTLGGSALADNGTGDRTPEVTYTAQLRSALPVRQGYIRLKEIEAHYDSMSGDAKTKAKGAFDNYLAQSFDDKIVVVVQYGSSLPESDTTLATFWQSQSLETVKNTTLLSGPDGDRMQPIAFVAGRGAAREFQFVFPKNPAAAQAHPDAPVILEFVPPSPFANTSTPPDGAGGLGSPDRLVFKFQPKDMLVGGKVAY